MNILQHTKVTLLLVSLAPVFGCGGGDTDQNTNTIVDVAGGTQVESSDRVVLDEALGTSITSFSLIDGTLIQIEAVSVDSRDLQVQENVIVNSGRNNSILGLDDSGFTRISIDDTSRQFVGLKVEVPLEFDYLVEFDVSENVYRKLSYIREDSSLLLVDDFPSNGTLLFAVSRGSR